MEIFSDSPSKLSKIYKSIFADLTDFYKRINPDKLNPDDRLFYRNTETPFRFTDTTLTLPSSVYNLSAKYGVPLVGGAELDTSLLTTNFPDQFVPESIKESNIKGLDAQTVKKWNYKRNNRFTHKSRQIHLMKTRTSIPCYYTANYSN